MRYLVALDGWEQSRRALRFALEQADGTGTAIDVVHVVDDEREDRDPAAIQQVEDTVDEVVAATDTDVTVEVHVLEADKDIKPATRAGVRILEFAHEHDHDAVYLGNEHTGAAEKMIVGSVSATVIDDQSVPVVLVP